MEYDQIVKLAWLSLESVGAKQHGYRAFSLLHRSKTNTITNSAKPLGCAEQQTPPQVPKPLSAVLLNGCNQFVNIGVRQLSRGPLAKLFSY